MILLVALLCGAGAVALLGVEVAGRRGSSAALARVAAYGRREAPAQEVAVDRSDALPPVAWLGRSVARLLPARDVARATRQLQEAGARTSRLELYLAAKTVLGTFGLVFGLAAGIDAGSPFKALLYGVLVGAAGFVAPDLGVRSRGRARRDRIQAELPNALDLLAVIVEAGLGLDAALARYASTAEGPVAEEIALLATEVRMGGSREDALEHFAERVPVPEVRSFTRAVVHADRLGSSLTQTLRALATDARFRRQALAEENANKAPVKLLFPTVFCIFPVLFVVVLGPPLIQFAGSL